MPRVELLSEELVGGSQFEVIAIPELQESDKVQTAQVFEPGVDEARLDAVWTHDFGKPIPNFDGVIPPGSLLCMFNKAPSAGIQIKAVVERA